MNYLIMRRIICCFLLAFGFSTLANANELSSFIDKMIEVKQKDDSECIIYTINDKKKTINYGGISLEVDTKYLERNLHVFFSCANTYGDSFRTVLKSLEQNLTKYEIIQTREWVGANYLIVVAKDDNDLVETFYKIDFISSGEDHSLFSITITEINGPFSDDDLLDLFKVHIF